MQCHMSCTTVHLSFHLHFKTWKGTDDFCYGFTCKTLEMKEAVLSFLRDSMLISFVTQSLTQIGFKSMLLFPVVKSCETRFSIAII